MTLTEPQMEIIKLNGLVLSHSDNGGESFTEYDIGLMAMHSLYALQKAVLMAEQIVTSERLVKALDIADFYAALNSAIEEDNGQGVLSEPGQMASIQDELQALIDWVLKARSLSRRPVTA